MSRPAFDASELHLAQLDDLCPIVDGAIVSKTMLDVGGCRQIIFAMDGGQTMSDHKAPFVAVVHLLDGRLRFRVGGSDRDLRAGSWLVMPPDEPHALESVEPARFLLTLIKSEG